MTITVQLEMFTRVETLWRRHVLFEPRHQQLEWLGRDENNALIRALIRLFIETLSLFLCSLDSRLEWNLENFRCDIRKWCFLDSYALSTNTFEAFLPYADHI